MPQNAPSSRHIVYQRFRLSTPMLAFLGLFGSAAITLQILPTLISILLALFELLLISSVSFFQQPWFSIPLIYIAYTLYQTDKKPESRSFRNLSPCIQELHKERRQFHEETTALLKALRDTGCDKDVYRHLEDVTVLSKNMATLIEDFMEVQTAVVCSMKASLERLEGVAERLEVHSSLLASVEIQRRELRSYLKMASRSTTVMEEDPVDSKREGSVVVREERRGENE